MDRDAVAREQQPHRELKATAGLSKKTQKRVLIFPLVL